MNVRKTQNRLFEISRVYHHAIPLDALFSACAESDLIAVQEDGEPWAGILCGREGRVQFDLTHHGKPVARALAMQWHKMPSGRYEINAYIS